MKLPHPIQYQGSKRNLAPRILNFIPDNIYRLVEPFAGTGALSIASASKNKAKKYLLNDLNKSLIKLLELIVNKPNEIISFYTKLWNEQHNDSIEHYYQVRKSFNRTNDPRLFLYLLSRCVKGSVRYNNEGFFNQSPDKRRKGANPENMARNIKGVSFLLKGKTIFKSLDYKKILNNCNENDLVYMDPPYQGVCNNKDARYFSGIDHNEFIQELNILNKRNIDYIISYDGKCGNIKYGDSFPSYLNLYHIELSAGRSSQATLLGRDFITIESLYLSPSLVKKIDIKKIEVKENIKQLSLF